ncbi:MAG TPA: A24 family peptidase [Clostridia bacterium]|nr:A24 family peptidase [Clostridia bacterium]
MLYTAFVVAFMVVVVTSDLLYRRIPNAITVTGFCVGLVFHSFNHTMTSAFVGAAVGFVVGFLMFYVAAIGAGDLKLLVALGAILGIELWTTAMVLTVIAAGLMGLVQAIGSRKLGSTLRNMGAILVHMWKFGFRPHPELNVRNKALIRSPFGVAAGVGVLLTVLR